MNEIQAVNEIIAEEKLWSNGSVMAYHVTPFYTISSIEKIGVHPAYAKGKMRACWYVSKPNILWAIAHVSMRHSYATCDLSVCVVMLPRNAIKRSAFSQMFYVKDSYFVATITPASYFITLAGGENE